MTTIKIRGKRSAVPAEKWRVGKRKRPVRRTASPTTFAGGLSALPRSSQCAAAARQKSRQQTPETSMLEQMPAEIVQDIFVLSGNVELPLASSTLRAQLCSQHVYTKMTTSVLRHVLSLTQDTSAGAAELTAATRLFGSRFMTLDFFRIWLTDQLPPHGPNKAMDCGKAWAEMRPSTDLLPPRKLLHGPWTPQKTELLRLFVQDAPLDLARLSPAMGAIALEGACEAIADGAHEALGALLSTGVRPTTELFGHAIVDNGCDRDIVKTLCAGVQRYASVLSEKELTFDTLDPVLWSWAEKARQRGDDSGDFVVLTLRKVADEFLVRRDGLVVRGFS
ncbi:hypothetical protein LTR53_003016 [Teratosphaeriaceae sp. CCFEE 6253]|nr:hypothetical protein LTR53_003016 [Teratosphaeriaceae sp. CCFEE 6253]